ncbi:MAG: hypothetical protein J3K34DRAFT_146101 [Monoraphidium minutum]|nr:MAG: hypothetical protein J3K34DRAFT_146101 [Monoraphidium minutum]
MGPGGLFFTRHITRLINDEPRPEGNSGSKWAQGGARSGRARAFQRVRPTGRAPRRRGTRARLPRAPRREPARMQRGGRAGGAPVAGACAPWAWGGAARGHTDVTSTNGRMGGPLDTRKSHKLFNHTSACSGPRCAGTAGGGRVELRQGLGGGQCCLGERSARRPRGVPARSAGRGASHKAGAQGKWGGTSKGETSRARALAREEGKAAGARASRRRRPPAQDWASCGARARSCLLPRALALVNARGLITGCGLAAKTKPNTRGGSLPLLTRAPAGRPASEHGRRRGGDSGRAGPRGARATTRGGYEQPAGGAGVQTAAIRPAPRSACGWRGPGLVPAERQKNKCGGKKRGGMADTGPGPGGGAARPRAPWPEVGARGVGGDKGVARPLKRLPLVFMVFQCAQS